MRGRPPSVERFSLRGKNKKTSTKLLHGNNPEIPEAHNPHVEKHHEERVDPVRDPGDQPGERLHARVAELGLFGRGEGKRRQQRQQETSDATI